MFWQREQALSGSPSWRLRQLEGAGEDAGGGGLAGAAGPAEEVGVGDAVLQDGLAEDGGNVLLAGEVGEATGPPFAV